MNSQGLYRDEAVRNQARQEPMDLLARTSTPHERSFHISLLLVIVVTIAWITFGTLDHSLWIQDFKLTSGPTSSTTDGLNSEHNVFFELEFALYDDDLSVLQPGRPVYLLSGYQDVNTIFEGILVQTIETDTPQRLRAVCQFDIETNGQDTLASLSDGHTIRIPLGSLTPLQYLARLSRSMGVDAS